MPNWSRKEYIQRGLIVTAGYLAVVIPLYIWRMPTSCGRWDASCDVSWMASFLYTISALGGSRLAVQPYNYWKKKRRDVSNLRNGNDR